MTLNFRKITNVAKIHDFVLINQQLRKYDWHAN